ncbi:hypothetical protein B0H34DRAFT_727344, partial [Crassisporium funariophilum]
MGIGGWCGDIPGLGVDGRVYCCGGLLQPIKAGFTAAELGVGGDLLSESAILSFPLEPRQRPIERS